MPGGDLSAVGGGSGLSLLSAGAGGLADASAGGTGLVSGSTTGGAAKAIAEGGSGGGEIVATGTPEDIVTNRRSHTGKALSVLLS